MTSFLTLDDLTPEGKVILLRADLNVPMQGASITDTTRIDRLVPTLHELSKKGGKTVILSHFGRPKGRDESQSLALIAKALSTALGQNVGFVDDCIGDKPKAAIADMKNGDVILLENVRFYAEEEKDDIGFAREIASLGDIYVNDAFSCAHRAHATTHGIAHLLPSYAGRLMEAELKALESALENPARPVVGIVGGAKVSTKIALLNNLVQKLDVLVLGGGMANTFFSAKDLPVGKSLCEREMKPEAVEIMRNAKKHGCELILPLDGLAAEAFMAHAKHRVTDVDHIHENEMLLDIGPRSADHITQILQTAKTVLWNGPLGAFELPPFDSGTVAVAGAVGQLTAAGKITSVAGGGDTVAALAHAGVESQFTYVSAAGGAFLEWLEGQTLPGVQALQDSAAAKEAKTA